MTMKFKPKGEMNERALIDVAALLMPKFSGFHKNDFTTTQITNVGFLKLIVYLWMPESD